MDKLIYGRAPDLPWGKWLDGEEHRIDPAKFGSSIESVRASLYRKIRILKRNGAAVAYRTWTTDKRGGGEWLHMIVSITEPEDSGVRRGRAKARK